MDTPTPSNGTFNKESLSPSKNAQNLFARKRYNESTRASRQLWWSPKPSTVEIPSDSVIVKDAKPKVDSMSNISYRPRGGQVTLRSEPVKWQTSSKVNSLSNIHWTPPAPQVNIQQEKLNWKAQPKVNSLDNVHHKPIDRSVEIYHEKLDFTHVTPRVDCGFSN
ncbi:unnamed protein product [Rotaria magnacalcarata]|uniref:Uncharacterized protein n=3 Tax=Rotaria magnacalcarata TaxID=392030 RepID=A0A819TMD1_9BILA|nr:unnamed protein product [Rotaria magnacalcarata]CAF1666362.1 unnamed protein product [Rotaria magnacalcarata]CAF2007983.1 unnamed protein product [Rotaria magnacalcarata]CAF2077250.1 unnamed protein product [Rotaria magnacalcarata]CAF2134724.1 unnamed protein product [Rotaria magnacalcarata]